MGRIKKAVQLTENPHLNLYELETQDRKGHPGCYYVASRAKHTEDLELVRKQQKPDGVIIYSLYGEKRDKVVLVRQYRYPIDGYLYEFPAGLVEPGEDYHDAAVREMKEETGLDLQPIPVDNFYAKPYYTTIGMTDECCATVYGVSDGMVSLDGLEDTEDLEVVIADRDEVRRILKEERVAIVCSYMLMNFLHDKEPFEFLNEEAEAKSRWRKK